MLWRLTTLLFLVACVGRPDYSIVTPELPPPPPGLGEILANSAVPPPTMELLNLEPDPQMTFARAVLPGDSESPPPLPALPIAEVRLYPNGPYNTSMVEAPPQIHVIHVPNEGTENITIQFTTSGEHGIPDRDAWLVISPNLLFPPRDWGQAPSETILQLVDFGIILPFPAGQTTDFGPNDQFHRQPVSGIVQLHSRVHLTAPIFMQLIVAAPLENNLGYVVTQAVGLIPEGF